MKLLNGIAFVLAVGLFSAQTAFAGKSCATHDRSDIMERASKYQDLINKHSNTYGVDSRLVIAIITNESCFKSRAVSHAGAKGLMQLMPAAAKRFGVKDRFNPDQNIKGGVKYLAFLIKHFKGDMKKVIAAYHAGEGNVRKYKGVPPFRYTRGYVKNVSLVYSKLGGRSGTLVLKKKMSRLDSEEKVANKAKFTIDVDVVKRLLQAS